MTQAKKGERPQTEAEEVKVNEGDRKRRRHENEENGVEGTLIAR